MTQTQYVLRSETKANPDEFIAARRTICDLCGIISGKDANDDLVTVLDACDESGKLTAAVARLVERAAKRVAEG